MNILIAMIIFLQRSYAQKPLQDPSPPPPETITYTGEMIKAKRYFTVGVISMTTGGILMLFSSKMGLRSADAKNITIGGAGLSIIGLGAIIQSEFHSKRARKLKKD